MTILMLAVLRLLWRLFNRPPELPAAMTPIEKTLARGTHILFYVLLFVMPLTGWMMSSAKNYSVSWFDLFTWPNLIAPGEAAFNLLRAVHDTLSWLLFALALLHILAALKHHFWNKDDVLRRMLPFIKPEKRIMKKLVLKVLCCVAFAAAADAGTVASYTADPQQSKLEFVGVQAGAEFKGVFHKFTAAVDFAPDALAASRIDVQIDMSSVDSLDKDRDSTIRGKDIFDVAHNPTAHYVTKSISKSAAGYAAVGVLTLRGVAKDVPIEFQFLPAPAGAKLTGTAKLNRLDFGVGQGDWKSTETIGDAVKINFALVLKPKT